jgi:hypothetical protein
MLHPFHRIEELNDFQLLRRCIPTNEELEIPLLRFLKRMDQLEKFIGRSVGHRKLERL